LKAKAYSPGGLSGFFSTHIVEGDLLHTGAWGGGIALRKGVYVAVEVEEGTKTEIITTLNGKRADLFVSRRVAERLLLRTDKQYRVIIKQSIELPMGGGLGTSGASALATALALGKALGLKLTYEELAREAHIAEVECKTGLGTISGLVTGGVVLVIKPGAPGFDRTVRILAEPSLRVVIGFYAPIEKKKVLEGKDISRIDEIGREALSRILEKTDIVHFLETCKWFSQTTGLMGNRVKRGIEAAEKAGALGASQAMIGETVFALVEKDMVEDVSAALRTTGAKITISEIEWCAARLL